MNIHFTSPGQWTTAVVLTGLVWAGSSWAAQPSFECRNLKSSIEEMICQDDQLADLDQKLSAVYDKALKTLPSDEINELKTFQRGWIKGRNDCWKADDKHQCVTFEYQTRITELQIMTGSVMVPAAVVFDCGDQPRIEAYFYRETEIPAAVLNRTPEQITAFLSPSGSGAKYEGRNVSLWNKGDEAMVTWSGQEMRCHVIPSSNQ